MGKSSFNLMITGQLLEGASQTRAVQGLARLLSLDEDKAQRLLDGTERTIKRGISMDMLPRYQSALRKIGVESRFRPATLSNELHSGSAQALAPVAKGKPSGDASTVPHHTPLKSASHPEQLSVAEVGETLPPQAKPEPLKLDPIFQLSEPGVSLEPLPRDKRPPIVSIDHLSLSE